jgi:hypothetical protein
VKNALERKVAEDLFLDVTFFHSSFSTS